MSKNDPPASRNGRSVDAHRVQFGDFEFSFRTQRLLRNGRRVHLRPQVATLLAQLLSNVDRVVTREELHELLWGTGHFGDHDRGLNQCVKELRRTLGDSALSPRFVETLPSVGYRFVAEVSRPRQSLLKRWFGSSS